MLNVKSRVIGGNLHFQTPGGVDIMVINGATGKLEVTDLEAAISAITAGDLADEAVETAKIADGAVTTVKIADLNVTAAKLADALSGLGDGLGVLRVARATFDPTATAGQRTQAAHNLGVTIPDKAIVVGGVVQVVTAVTSGGSATLALSVQSANDIITAAAVSGAPWSTTGLKAIVPKSNTPESTGIALTAARAITATVATADLTGGKLHVFLHYLMGS